MGNQFLALSLFIMLLSFFIILNAMSNFEVTKSREVLNSITVAFSEEETSDDISANIQEDPMASYREGDTLDKLKSLFEAQITGVEAKKNRLGTTMHLRMNLDHFDQQITSEDGRFGGELGPTLVSLLGTEDSVPYSMDMMINIEQSPSKAQNEQPEDVAQRIRRVSGYANMIEEAGLPRKFLTAGLARGPEGTIDLFFRRYEAFNPLGEREE